MINPDEIDLPNRVFRLPLSTLAQKAQLAVDSLEPWIIDGAQPGKQIIDLELYSSNIFLLHTKAKQSKSILNQSNESLYKVQQKSTSNNLDKLFKRPKKSTPVESLTSKPIQKFKYTHQSRSQGPAQQALPNFEESEKA
jgi:hypothetical protein